MQFNYNTKSEEQVSSSGFPSGTNLYYSSGTIEKPTITWDSGTSTISIGIGIYRSFLTTNFTGVMIQFTVPATSFLLLDGQRYYICAKYNNGSPIVYAEQDVSATNDSDVIVIFTVFTEGGELDVLDWGTEAVSLANKLNERLIDTQRFARSFGFNLSENSRVMTSAGGEFYLGSNKIMMSQISSDTDECELLYKNGSGGWTETEITVYPNTQYDNGTGTLAILNNGEYGVIWVWRSAGNYAELYTALGSQGYTSVDQAKGSRIPSDLPQKVLLGSFLLGRIIFLKGATSGVIESAFDTVFNANSPTTHSALLGLQGGTTGQYNHLTNAQLASYDKMISVVTNASKAIVYESAIDTHTFNQTTNFAKLILTLTPESISGGFSYDSVNSRLVYTGATKRFLFNGTSTLLNCTTNNTTISFRSYKNGNIALVQTNSVSKLTSSTDKTNINAASGFLLNNNDYIEIFAQVDKNCSFDTQSLQLQINEDLGYSYNGV